jgi:hypothetical protein
MRRDFAPYCAAIRNWIPLGWWWRARHYIRNAKNNVEWKPVYQYPSRRISCESSSSTCSSYRPRIQRRTGLGNGIGSYAR